MRLRHAPALIVLSTLLAAGCGGGAGGGGTTPTDTSFNFGELSGRAAVSNPPISTSSASVIGTAFTGTFSSLKIRELNPGLQETRILASSDAFVPFFGLVSFAIDGTDLQKLTIAPNNGTDTEPSAAANGKVVFTRRAPDPTIQMMNMDGTGITQMVGVGSEPSIDLAGDKFSYIAGPQTFNVMTVATQAITHLPLPANSVVYNDAISPDGTTVYALLAFNTDFTIYAFASNGSGSPRLIRDLGVVDASGLAVSPDGTQVVMAVGNPIHLVRIGTSSSTFADDGALPPTPYLGSSYSPDGKEVVTATSDPTSSAGLYLASVGSTNFVRLTDRAYDVMSPCWTPFIKDRTLISGGGGLLGTRACGVILGQTIDGSTASVVAFDVVTPSSVVMTAQQPASGLVSTNLVFSVDADSITKLAYANTFNWRGIRAIGSGTPVTSANGALVSLNGADGSVVSVLPFTGTRALGSRPTVHDNGSIRTFSGSFLAAYDKNGKNLAPNGASVVMLDTKSGVLSVER